MKRLTDKILLREDYLNIIEHIIEMQRNSVCDYLDELYLKYGEANSFFIETLYRDINYVCKDVYMPGDNDLIIENGDFVIEDGDLKLTGKPNNLTYAALWLHQKLVEKRLHKASSFEQAMNALEGIHEYVELNNNTPDHNAKLEEINKKLKLYRKGKKSNVKRTEIHVGLKYVVAIGGLIGVVLTALKLFGIF